MKPDELTELELPNPPAAEEEEGEQFDKENRLKSEFVRSVSEALEEGDETRVYELV